MTISTFSGEGVAVSPALALTCRTVPAEAALMRVRSSAASAAERSARAAVSATSGRVGAGSPSAASALRRLARACSSRSLDLLTASRAFSTSALLAVAARLVGAIELVPVLHELPLGIGHRILGGSAILSKLARGALGVVALALAHRRLRERGIGATYELLVVEARQEIAGGNLVVEGNQHLRDAARQLRADPHLAADRLHAASGRCRPAALGRRFRLGRAVGLDAVAGGLDAVDRRLGAERLRHVVADAEREYRRDDQHVE